MFLRGGSRAQRLVRRGIPRNWVSVCIREELLWFHFGE